MTTALDTKLVPKVLALLARLGATATLKTKTAAEYDPTLTSQAIPTGTPDAVKITPPEIRRAHAIAGAGHELRLLTFVAASGLTTVPVAGKSLLTIGARTYIITAVGDIYTGDEIALYELEVEKQ